MDEEGKGKAGSPEPAEVKKKSSKTSVKSGGSKKGSKEESKSEAKGGESKEEVKRKTSKGSVKSGGKPDDQETPAKRKSRESVDSKNLAGASSTMDASASKDTDAASVKSVDSKDSRKSKDKSKDKGKKEKEEKRGSLKFGDDDDEPKEKKKSNKGKPKEEGRKEKSKAGFDPSQHQKPTVVIFHDNNDLMWGKGVGYKPDDAVPKSGPGITNEIEKTYGPCALLSEFKYTTWADTVVPLRNHNVVQGFNEMALCLTKLAANGGENLSHEDAFLAVSFLSNVRNDLGEHPPNILALMEHIDYLTKGQPQFKKMDACHLDQWY